MTHRPRRHRDLLSNAVTCVTVICLVLSPTASAQVQNGQITRLITDPSGAVVAGAGILVRNPATGYEADLESNDAGIYSASELLVGSYTIRVESSGFKTGTTTSLVVNAGTVLRVDFELVLGERWDTVEVI